MAFGPITVGDSGAPLAPQFLDDSGNSLLVGLSPASISLLMVNAATGTQKAGAGVWYIDNAAAGQAHYVYNAADVNTAGEWDMFITLQQANGPQHVDSFHLTIKPLPGQ